MKKTLYFFFLIDKLRTHSMSPEPNLTIHSIIEGKEFF